MPFDRSASSSRTALSPQSGYTSNEKQRPGIVRVASDRNVPAAQWYSSRSELGQRETQSATEPKAQAQAQLKGQVESTEKDPDEVVMSSTSYPGQEWTPDGFRGWEYF